MAAASQQRLEEQLHQAQRQLRNQRQQLDRLRERVAQLERVVDHCLGDATATWLYRNRSERLDPTVPIFDPLRAEFHLARYRFAAGFAEGQRVVDAACGTGYGSRLLVEQGAAVSALGFDCCAEAIGYAREKHGIPGVEFAVADVRELPLDAGTAELVVSFETVEHVEDDEQLIGEFARVLPQGGRLIISTPNAWPLEIAAHHVREYDLQAFQVLLARHFRIDQIFNQNSGSDSPFNHGQPAGWTPTTEANAPLAECYVAICTKL